MLHESIEGLLENFLDERFEFHAQFHGRSVNFLKRSKFCEVDYAFFFFLEKIDQFYLSHFEGPSISSNPLLRLSLVQKRQIIGVLDRSEIDPFFKKIPELLTS